MAAVTQGENVVAMRGRQLALEGPLRQVEACWRALAEVRGAVPRRSDIDPRALEGALGTAFLLEQVAPGVARFRVAGQSVCARMGMDVRGMPISALFVASARAPLAVHLTDLFHGPALVELALGPAGRLSGKARGRMLLLPLADDTGRSTRALGAVDAGVPAGRNARLDIVAEPLRLERLGACPPVPQSPSFAPFSVIDGGRD